MARAQGGTEASGHLEARRAWPWARTVAAAAAAGTHDRRLHLTLERE